MRKRKLAVTLLLFLLVLVYGFVHISSGISIQTDDYAAYLNEAFAIANGTLEEESYLYPLMHPSVLEFPQGEKGPYLVYVWGVPAYLSVIYRLLGKPAFSSEQMFYYQLPSIFFLAGLVAVLYLFYRRRFSPLLSVLLCLSVVFCYEVVDQQCTILTDLLFLLLSMLCFFFGEAFWEPKKGCPRPLIYGILTGLSLFAALVTRLNGIGLIFPLGLYFLRYWIARRKDFSWKRVLLSLLPFAVAAAAWGLSLLFLPQATSNTSDLKRFTFSGFFRNLVDYTMELCVWFVNSFFPWVNARANLKLAALFCLPFVLLFLLSRKIKKEIPLFAYAALYLIIASMLDYTQGQRYLIPLMPLLMLFAGHGMAWLKDKVPASGFFTQGSCRGLRRYIAVFANLQVCGKS